MSNFIATLQAVWSLMFGWMPAPIAAATSIIVGLMMIIVIIKIIAAILDAIPFL